MVIVFGGSFNPPTRAHLEIIKKLLDTYRDSTVLVLPVGNDYKKSELIDFKHRFEMLKLLTKGLDRVILSDLEAHKTYNGTLGSLDELSKTYQELCFVTGADNLNQFHTWINYEKLLRSYPFLIMTRKSGLSKEEAEKLFESYEHYFTYIPFEMDVQSSDIRKNINAHQKDLTEEVLKYIQENHLYGV